ncbi:hypothetical protein [Cytobacillus kochii]|uniref:hypothetical protein n=1 Tax=Cytobacillus kochii TaxID=859143 RepID=UPI00402AF49E
MEIVTAYINQAEKKQVLLTLATDNKREEKQEVDLGDLIERLKLQIDMQIGR